MYQQNKLLNLANLKLKKFQKKLIPTISEDAILGIYTNDLKAYAKALYQEKEYASFLKALPHQYFEENQLHAFLLNLLKDYDECLSFVNYFLPFIDNWATCDQLKPSVFKKHLSALFEQIKLWLKSDHPFTIRFGIKCLMNFYLEEAFNDSIIPLVLSVKSDDYYVKMMMAWFFQVGLVKQKEKVLPYFINGQIDDWVQNKAIQKAKESYLISDDLKEELLKYRK